MQNHNLRPNRKFVLISLIVIILALVMAWPVLNRRDRVTAAPGGLASKVQDSQVIDSQDVPIILDSPAAPDVYASPLHGGCYIAAPSDCRLHVEPFTINLTPSTKMVKFKLVAIRTGGLQTVIYDWRPDQSNPAPSSGAVYTPSLVTQDFAAVCGKAYEISLQGQDSGDVSLYNLGLTGEFTCPSSVP